jgi:hypothetical protein
VDINRAQEIIRVNIKMSVKDSLGYYKAWFDKGWRELLYQRKQVKLQ